MGGGHKIGHSCLRSTPRKGPGRAIRGGFRPLGEASRLSRLAWQAWRRGLRRKPLCRVYERGLVWPLASPCRVPRSELLPITSPWRSAWPFWDTTVAYLAGRSDGLSVMLLLAAYGVFLYRRHAAVSWRDAVLLLVIFAASLLAKEHTIVLPALFLLTDYWWNPGFSLTQARAAIGNCTDRWPWEPWWVSSTSCRSWGAISREGVR